MSADSKTLSAKARRAAQAGNWTLVDSCAKQILHQQTDSAEGYFLAGLAAKATRRVPDAINAFESALALDTGRYDAAIELAGLLLSLQQHAKAHRLLEAYRGQLNNSPRYLDMAGSIYSSLALPSSAWPLHARANKVQPNVSVFQANLAACCVQVGRIDEARALYQSLLKRYPAHQRNHFELSGLEKASDDTHIQEMKAILATGNKPPEKNIFLYYAIGKELEDLGQWDESFSYYKMAGDAVTQIATYDVGTDETLTRHIAEVCSAAWLDVPGTVKTEIQGKTPIFIVGLPRTGTTLTDRILSSHSTVESIGESHYMSLAIRRASGVQSRDNMNPAIIDAAAKADISGIANGYLNEVQYRFGDKPLFIEKLPENILYTGFIAKAFPEAKLVHVCRHPMDACFAMYKQSYFKFAYSLDSLARYYIAYDRLVKHWRKVLGSRLIEFSYESLVSDQEKETRSLLDRLGLPFEQACLEFETNPAASTTASAAQIRQKIHRGSIGKWRHFEQHLKPLRDQLEAANIHTD